MASIKLSSTHAPSAIRARTRNLAIAFTPTCRPKGVRCWLASEDLKIGAPFHQRSKDAIRLHDKLLVVLSETSVASSWVETEVLINLAALERARTNPGETVLFQSPKPFSYPQRLSRELKAGTVFFGAKTEFLLQILGCQQRTG